MRKVKIDAVILVSNSKQKAVCLLRSQPDNAIPLRDRNRLIAGFKDERAVMIHSNRSAIIRKTSERFFGCGLKGGAFYPFLQNDSYFDRVHIPFFDFIKRIRIKIILSISIPYFQMIFTFVGGQPSALRGPHFFARAKKWGKDLRILRCGWLYRPSHLSFTIRCGKTGASPR